MRVLLAVALALAASVRAPALRAFDTLRVVPSKVEGRDTQGEGEPGRNIAPAPGVVRIDVITTDAGGRAIDTLKTADFELREDGTPQSIEEVRFIKIAGAAGGHEPPPIRSERDEHTEAIGDNTRLVAIFLDDYHVSAGATTERVRNALTRFVDQDLGPRDLVTVMKPLDSLLTIRLTRDREEIHRAIDAFDGRKGAYAPRTAFERTYLATTPEPIEAARAQVTLSALSALAIHLGSLADARKTLVLVSEGLPRAERRRGLEPLPTFDSVVRAANRSNVSIYTVNPRESPASGDGTVADNQQETLRALANETDGEAIVGATDLEKGMRRIAGDSSAYYLLTYHSARSDDGRFHDVEVEVKRPDVHVRARKGYWAPTPGELMRANILAHAHDAAPVVPLEPARRTSPLVRPWFGLARGEAGRTRVTFVWEPAARVPGDRTAHVPARVVLTALGGDNRAVFEGPVLPAGPVAVDSREEASARAVFEVAPGRLRLRMSIEDGASNVIDSDIREITVRDLRAPVGVGTPEVLRARTARDVRAIAADPDAVPVASREFSRAEHLIVRFPAYAPGVERPRVSAKLLSRAGKAMRDLPVQPEAAPDGRNQIDLPLAGLAAGEYQLEITVTSPAGEARDLVGFRVTS